ncbi:MAG: AmmeMemoRadiSam system radical SAM enzyme, partial [Desulfovibrionaceae bacterium]|nr:AmmeMemoRadiSam system radical SAM enzyme [Desulfovibrionaceae bacterium]
MDRREFLKTCGRCALFCAASEALVLLPADPALALRRQKGLLGSEPSPFFSALGDGSVRCELCPRACVIDKGERGWCRVRENRDGRLYSLAYGNPCAVNIDPIEKKPFFHVLPTSRSLSVATAGCNFECKFCQNWEISQARPDDTYNYDLPPAEVARLAKDLGCRSIASTYVEPTIFTEYMLAMGREARERGLLKVMHSDGFVNQGPLDELCGVLSAVCVDLKAFTEDFYREMCKGELAPVLETLKRLKANKVHTEIVNLIIPGKNDDPADILEMCRWIKAELGPDTPLHFSRFTPQYKLVGLPPTPLATLYAARDTALNTGLEFVYVGNVPGNPGENTYCPGCGAVLINRVGFRSTVLRLEKG